MNTLIILTYILALSFVILAIEYNKLRMVNKELTGQLENPQAQIKTIKNFKSIYKNIKSDLYPYDENYDKLIRNIIETGEVIDITEHDLVFKVGNDVFSVWIANKSCAYGSHLSKNKDGFIIKDRGISRDTIKLLYSEELLYSTNNPKPSRKEIEDNTILELLGGNDETQI